MQVCDDIINSICLKFVAEWLSGDWTQSIVWNTTADSDVVYLTAQLQSPAVFNEFTTQPQWGTLYNAMKSVSGTDGSSVIRFFHSMLVI